MKKLLLSLALFLSACSRPLTSIELNSQAFVCDGQWRSVSVEGRFHITQAELWMGMYVNSIADFGYALSTENDVNIFRGNWDHYAEPTGIQDQLVERNFAPNYVEAKTLTLYFRCTSLNGTPTMGHVIVTVYNIP